MGQAAREFALTHLRREDAARKYVEFVQEVAAAPDQPITPIGFPPAPGRDLRRLFIASTYKLFRLGYLLRHYGLSDTVARIKQEMRFRD